LLKYFEVGRGMVFGRFLNMFSTAMIFGTFLSVNGIPFGFVELVVLAFVLSFLMLVSGILFIKSGIYDLEISSRNINNPEVMETLRIVKELNEKVKK